MMPVLTGGGGMLTCSPCEIIGCSSFHHRASVSNCSSREGIPLLLTSFLSMIGSYNLSVAAVGHELDVSVVISHVIDREMTIYDSSHRWCRASPTFFTCSARSGYAIIAEEKDVSLCKEECLCPIYPASPRSINGK